MELCNYINALFHKLLLVIVFYYSNRKVTKAEFDSRGNKLDAMKKLIGFFFYENGRFLYLAYKNN